MPSSAFRRIHDHALAKPVIVEPIDHAIAQFDHLARLRIRLPRIFRFSERDNLGELCYSERFFAASAAIWSAAFATNTELAEKMDAGYRYNAVCTAALRRLEGHR